MKFYLVYFIILIGFNGLSQERYLTKTGTVNFEASVPSFEEVAAKNSSTTAILNSKNGEFAALVLVNGFRFKNALMEEHFNENYAESHIYPKATFKGKIQDFSFKDLNPNGSFKISGEIEFHGKIKKLNDVMVRLSKKENGIEMTGNFILKATDFDIKIPKIVSNKVANDVKVSFTFELKEQ